MTNKFILMVVVMMTICKHVAAPQECSCANAGVCSNNSCTCRPKTSGDNCETYDYDSSSLGEDNMAINRSAYLCSIYEVVDFSNLERWNQDCCFHLTGKSMVIVDLANIITVEMISIFPVSPVSLQVNISKHLGGGCGLMLPVNCASANISSNFTQTLTCMSSVTGRYVGIQNLAYSSTVLCIEAMFGYRERVSLYQGRYYKMFSFLGPYTPFRSTSLGSKLACAASCLQEPFCLNFVWNDTLCSLYATTPSGNGHFYTLDRYEVT